MFGGWGLGMPAPEPKYCVPWSRDLLSLDTIRRQAVKWGCRIDFSFEDRKPAGSVSHKGVVTYVNG